MFDVAFSEILVIAVVALIVIGPEKLPKVARTLGHLTGKFQRYIGNVKSEIEREMQFEELQKLQDELKARAESKVAEVKQTMQEVPQSMSEELSSAIDAAKDIHRVSSAETVASIDPVRDEATPVGVVSANSSSKIESTQRSLHLAAPEATIKHTD